MNITTSIITRKIATILLITVSVAAFATLGDGGKKSSSSTKTLLSKKPTYNFKNFSLKTGYQYRGATVFNMQDQNNHFVPLSTVVTYHKGNTTYILPMKKKLVLDKIKFAPAPQARF